MKLPRKGMEIFSVAIPFKTGSLFKSPRLKGDLFLSCRNPLQNRVTIQILAFGFEINGKRSQSPSKPGHYSNSFIPNNACTLRIVAIPFKTGSLFKCNQFGNATITVGRNPLQNRVTIQIYCVEAIDADGTVAIPFKTGSLFKLSSVFADVDSTVAIPFKTGSLFKSLSEFLTF